MMQTVSIAQSLRSRGYHPVLIFGTRASGKSSLLASLFQFLESPSFPGIAVFDKEPIIPVDTEYGEEIFKNAKRFFEGVMDSFHAGRAAPRTYDNFFIPIEIIPNNGLPPVKLAFLESRGESYQIDRNAESLFPPPRPEVADIYQNFLESVSLLVIAPYTLANTYVGEEENDIVRNEIRNSDTAMYAALQGYLNYRAHREHDHHLFLLTKWDARTRGPMDPEFISPPRGLVEHLIAERFPRSWTLFRNMQTRPALSLQYSSGIMIGEERLNVPADQKMLMERFPKVLSEWLYSNASGGLSLSAGLPEQEGQGMPGLLNRFFRWLKRALS